MRDDFCAFILTHGRPERVLTHTTLARCGYTGRSYIVIDDEDAKADEYRRKFGKRVLTFSKSEVAATFDQGDNFDDRRTIVYARNACFELAKKVGCRYFVQLDDDYHDFEYRIGRTATRKYLTIRRLDEVFGAILDYLISVPSMRTIALAQGGDFIGGNNTPAHTPYSLRRKAMNSFFCDGERPFQFVGRINEDVNTYVVDGRRGELFFTVMAVSLGQKATQSNAGGMTDVYLENGTYLKTFYTVMYAPSCVKVSQMRDTRKENFRIHHKINWNRTAPKILSERWRKAADPTTPPPE